MIPDILSSPVSLYYLQSKKSNVIFPFDDRGQGLVQQDTDKGIDKAFAQGEGQIEDQQRLDKVVRRRKNIGIHADNHLRRKAHELSVERVNKEIVFRHAYGSHCQ